MAEEEIIPIGGPDRNPKNRFLLFFAVSFFVFWGDSVFMWRKLGRDSSHGSEISFQIADINRYHEYLLTA
jgi:hypothetical protein